VNVFEDSFKNEKIEKKGRFGRNNIKRNSAKLAAARVNKIIDGNRTDIHDLLA
jgi:hypothetical protein